LHWNTFIQAARVRSTEDADEAHSVWTPDQLRNATHEAVRQAGADATCFVKLRASALCDRAGGRLRALSVPSAPAWGVTGGWLLAFACGWLLAGIGQDREINLLALPLIGILLWNAIVVILSILASFKKQGQHEEDSWFMRAIEKLNGNATGDASSLGASRKRFKEIAWPVVWQRFGMRARAWFHIGAALLALGSISAMYARGWSREYRAVWESTLLDERGATRFFNILFSPASLVTGVSIPVGELSVMRRGVDHAAERPGAALPWIHLYAGTLLLLVGVPRILLTGFELWRARGAGDAELSKAEWQSYARRLMSFAAVGNARARVLVHGVAVNEEAEARWRLWLRRQLPDIGPLTVQTIPGSAEAEFAAQFTPGSEPLLLVFNAAATPEAEVHRELVAALAAKLHSSKQTAPLMIGLDDSDLRKRWSGLGDCAERLATRTASWHTMMEGLSVQWL
jgi:hypothetical protein